MSNQINLVVQIKCFRVIDQMNIQSLTYITLVATFFVLAVTVFLPIVESQDEDGEEEQVPTGQVVNSKYLTISGVTFNEDDNQVNIAGTITNNSTDQSFATVSIVGQLYDDENRMITSSSGVPALANLGPGQQSAFTITTNLPSDEETMRYIVLPGGSAVEQIPHTQAKPITTPASTPTPDEEGEDSEEIIKDQF